MADELWVIERLVERLRQNGLRNGLSSGKREVAKQAARKPCEKQKSVYWKPSNAFWKASVIPLAN